ncbi:MAG: hypothetical protein EA402_07385 [Planctomycetota bacterium]|nr:MAG: hypothetical protein EA402_07385 [Planctomycetota bacterium]
MRLRLVSGLAVLALPLASLAASELPQMVLKPVQPPPPQSASDHLVDAVIPAYGVRSSSPYRLSSRMNELYHQVQQFTGDLDARVLTGALAVKDDVWKPAANDPFPQAARPRLVPAGLLPEQEELLVWIQRVSEFEAATPLPNHYERWHINTAYRDLFRASDHLALAIGDERFANLRHKHRAWMDYYHRLRQAELVRMAAEIIETGQAQARRPNLDQALQEASRREIQVAWPAMSIDLENDPYPPVFLPAIPRWSEMSEEVRNRFIDRFGIPGQNLRVAYPVDEGQEALIDPDFEDALPEDLILETDGEFELDLPAVELEGEMDFEQPAIEDANIDDLEQWEPPEEVIERDDAEQWEPAQEVVEDEVEQWVDETPAKVDESLQLEPVEPKDSQEEVVPAPLVEPEDSQEEAVPAPLPAVPAPLGDDDLPPLEDW